MVVDKARWDEQKQRLLKASKFFSLFTIIYSLWIALVIMGIYFLNLGDRWALLSLSYWILTAIALLSIALSFEIILLIQFTLSKKKKIQPMFIQGKKVYNYTIPIDAYGGIFSKTYILIDKKRVLNLRYQMIPPEELWEQKQ